MTTRFKVADATCGHCKATIESAVSGLDEVREVDLDLVTKTVTVVHADGVTPDQLKDAITRAGYTPEPVA